MDKVIIPKEVAEAIEKVWGSRVDGEGERERHMYLTNWDWLFEHHDGEWSIIGDYAEANPITYMRALVEGYDVEQTSEERAVELFKKWTFKCNDLYDESYYHRMEGAINILNILGIQIEGINKHT